MLPKASLSLLDNGVRLVTAHVQDSEMITVVIAIKVGTRVERPHERGISHLVEHQVFKGSRRFASSIELNAALASIGAYYNASTNMEYTYYVVTCRREHTREAIDIVSDIVLHPSLPKSEFMREKRVVFEETMIARQNDDHYVEIMFEKIMYQHQALGSDILGTFKSLRSIDRRDVISFIRRWYQGRRMAVAIVGNGNLQPFHRQAQEIFSLIPSGASRTWKPFVRGKTHQRSQHMFRDERLTTMLYGVPGVSLSSPLTMPQELVRQTFGGAISSRLYNRIREEKGLVYDIVADTEYYSDAGHLSVYTQADSTCAQTVLDLIVEESKRLMQDKISAKELRTAKEVLYGELAMMPQNQEVMAVHYLKSVLVGGRLVQLSEMHRAISQTTIDTVRWLAWVMFWEKPWYVASIGRKSPLQ